MKPHTQSIIVSGLTSGEKIRIPFKDAITDEMIGYHEESNDGKTKTTKTVEFKDGKEVVTNTTEEPL